MKSQTPRKTLNRKQLYRAVGHLLYAIAATDSVVRNAERRAMYDYIQDVLARMEHTYDSSGMNQAYYTQFTFEDAEKNRLPAHAALESFSLFCDNNLDLMDDNLRQAIFSAAAAVASAYRHVNKEEQALISSLRGTLGV